MVAVGQGEKLRLWVVAKGGLAKILRCFEQRNCELVSFNRLARDFAEVQFLIVNVERREQEGIKSGIMSSNTRMFSMATVGLNSSRTPNAKTKTKRRTSTE